MLRKVPFFGGLDPARLKLLAFTSRALRFAPGEELMREGDPADSAYVIIEGDVEIVGKTQTGEFVIGVLGVEGDKNVNFRKAMAAPAAMAEFKGNVVWVGSEASKSEGQAGVQCRGLAQSLGFQFP